MALERVFDGNDQTLMKQTPVKREDIEEINLGTELAPKKVYIGKRISPTIGKMLIALLRKYKDVFTWPYDDIKEYKEDFFQHEIRLKPDEKPYRKKQRPANPTFQPKLHEELMKLREGGIIKPIIYSTWVSNLVPIIKKNGDIRLCVDFRNLNISSLKDNYPIPNMEAMLQRVIGCELLSMMDGFSGYNQVKVNELEQYKIVFTTPWGTYVYIRMPFGITKIGVTFQ